MSIRNPLLTLLAFMTLTVSCVKQLDTTANDKIDWSKTSRVTLGAIMMSADTKAETTMANGERIRLYAVNPTTKEIIATQTYTITKGLPKVDGVGEEHISLPYGNVDIFIVSPVSYIYKAESDKVGGGTIDVTRVIASETEVIPAQGHDLVSSRTRVLVNKTGTTINPKALEHKMVKVQIDVNMSKDVDGGAKSIYVDGKMDGIKHFIEVGNVGISGTFTFDNDGGTITSDNTTSSARYKYKDGMIGAQNITKTNGTTSDDGEVGAVFSVTDYLMPVTGVRPTITTTFGYTLRVNPPTVTVKKEVIAHEFTGTVATENQINMNNGAFIRLSANPIPGTEMKCNATISPWETDKVTTIDPVNNTDLLFSYSGEDAPITKDGNQYWPDRSGNDNHALIVGKMFYDQINKCYYALSATSYFLVPSLGVVPQYTLELTAQTRNGAQNAVVNFGGNTGIVINLPAGTAIRWYSGSDIIRGLDLANKDKYFYNQINSYAFARGASNASSFIVNGKVMSNSTGTFDTQHVAFDGENRLWTATVDENLPNNAGIATHRIYGARMYKKDMSSAADCLTLKRNHTAVLSHLGVNIPIVNNELEYIKNGLIVDLRGTTAPTTLTWEDLSGNNNHLTLLRADQYNASNKCYKDKMTFSKSLGKYKELTIEFVAQSSNLSYSLPIIQFTPNEFSSNPNIKPHMGRSGIYYFDFNNNGANGIVWEAPYTNDQLRVRVPISKLEYISSTLSQLSCYRRGNKLYVAHNGYLYSNLISDADPDAVSDLLNGVVNKYSAYVDIYALRIYNRALSDYERQHNYLLDKQKYNILPH